MQHSELTKLFFQKIKDGEERKAWAERAFNALIEAGLLQHINVPRSIKSSPLINVISAFWDLKENPFLSLSESSLAEIWRTYGGFSGMSTREAFRQACKAGDMDMISRLIKIGIDLNKDANYNLYLASKNGHAAVVKKLLIECSDFEKHAHTGLFEAIKHGYEDIYAFLIEKVDTLTISQVKCIIKTENHHFFELALRLQKLPLYLDESFDENDRAGFNKLQLRLKVIQSSGQHAVQTDLQI